MMIGSNGLKLNTIDEKWSDLQTSKFNSNAQPACALLDLRNEKLMVTRRELITIMEIIRNSWNSDWRLTSKVNWRIVGVASAF